MPEINGIDYSAIDSISGVSKNRISEISGVSISPAPSCTTILLGYTFREDDPNNACLNEPMPYDFDGSTGMLYMEGGCGQLIARAGYYSDGRTIYIFDGISFVPIGACGR